MEKRCPSCKESKPESAYYKVKSRRDGLSIYCIPCNSNIQKASYSRVLSTKNCKRCGTSFVGKRNSKCCLDCVRKRNKKPLKYKNCVYCGYQFPYRDTLVSRSHGKVRRRDSIHCSWKCMILWRNKIYLPSLPGRSEMLSKRATKTFKGKKLSLEKREKLRERNLGEKSHFWKGGVSKENEKVRSSLNTRLWRKAVFERDNYTCQECGDRGRKGHPVILNADHIKPFAYFPELRFDISNGRTLCLNCHKKTDTWGSKLCKNTRA